MPKCRHCVSLTTDLIDNAMKGTLVHAPGPSLDQIAQIDDEFIFESRKLDPLVRSGMPNLQAILTRLLEEDS